MTTLLWIAQSILAIAFLMAGMMKLLQPKEQLIENMEVLSTFSPSAINTIGLVEVLGAIGVLLPVILDVLPSIVPWAAAGLVLDMIAAAATHVRRSEWGMVGVNAVLFTLAAFVAYRHWTMPDLAV